MNTKSLNEIAVAEEIKLIAENIVTRAAKNGGGNVVLALACNGVSRHHSPEINREVRNIAKRHPLVAHLF